MSVMLSNPGDGAVPAAAQWDPFQLMDRLDEAMAGEGKVHMFVETVSIQRIEMEGLPAHIQRAMPLLGKLNRFGRIAVVADQAWVRLGTRVESALLPFVSYQVYFPEQRDEALAWVEGRSAGQRRRVALAGVLLSGAVLWLLDEPTTNLDADGQRLVASLIEEQIARGGIVVAAVHHELTLSAGEVVGLDLGVA